MFRHDEDKKPVSKPEPMSMSMPASASANANDEDEEEGDFSNVAAKLVLAVDNPPVCPSWFQALCSRPLLISTFKCDVDTVYSEVCLWNYFGLYNKQYVLKM